MIFSSNLLPSPHHLLRFKCNYMVKISHGQDNFSVISLSLTLVNSGDAVGNYNTLSLLKFILSVLINCIIFTMHSRMSKKGTIRSKNSSTMMSSRIRTEENQSYLLDCSVENVLTKRGLISSATTKTGTPLASTKNFQRIESVARMSEMRIQG